MNSFPQIAVISPNTLNNLGLRHLLQKMMPQLEVNLFNSFLELIRDTPDFYFHYFISSDILLEHTDFFLERKHKTIVLTNGMMISPQLSDFHTLNIYQPEELLVKGLLRLEQFAHHQGKKFPQGWPLPQEKEEMHEDPNGLSAREIEVLIWIVKGLINKEIADKMNISLTTVISHRKNIMDKLGIRSVSGLTIYAVMNGYVAADRI